MKELFDSHVCSVWFSSYTRGLCLARNSCDVRKAERCAQRRKLVLDTYELRMSCSVLRHGHCRVCSDAQQSVGQALLARLSAGPMQHVSLKCRFRANYTIFLLYHNRVSRPLWHLPDGLVRIARRGSRV